MVLLEKSEFPREKVCGDGLTPRAVKQLVAMGIDTVGRRLGTQQRACGSSAAASGWSWTGRSSPATPDYGLTRTRMDFDEILAKAARRGRRGAADRHERDRPDPRRDRAAWSA